uniref:Uncharacterized protein n=1 Tax=Rhabditophanes sp. KR3021 TaxID=114890 RepID=A0AC35TK40_9BILA
MHSANGVGNNQKEKTFTFAIFAIGIAIFVMLVILLFVNCCKKSNSSKVQSNVNPRETHFLLNQSNQQTHMVEVALKTFNSPIQQENYYVFGSGEGDQSTIPVMIDEPTPTRNQSSILKQHPYSMNSSYATAYDPSSQQHYGRHVQFYAPPPSAASLSTTYGVVKQIPYTLRKANSTSTHSYVSESMPPPPYEYLHRPLPQQEGSSNSSNYYTLRSHTKSGRRPPANSRQGTTAESSDSEESNYL